MKKKIFTILMTCSLITTLTLSKGLSANEIVLAVDKKDQSISTESEEISTEDIVEDNEVQETNDDIVTDTDIEEQKIPQGCNCDNCTCRSDKEESEKKYLTVLTINVFYPDGVPAKAKIQVNDEIITVVGTINKTIYSDVELCDPDIDCEDAEEFSSSGDIIFNEDGTLINCVTYDFTMPYDEHYIGEEEDEIDIEDEEELDDENNDIKDADNDEDKDIEETNTIKEIVVDPIDNKTDVDTDTADNKNMDLENKDETNIEEDENNEDDELMDDEIEDEVDEN